MTEPADPPLTRRALRERHTTLAPAPEQTPPPRERSLLAYLGNAFMAVVLVAILAIAVATIVVPAVTKSTALTVLTSSMQPGLPPGTLIVVKPVDPDDIRAGDIITYQLRSGEPEVVTHRVTQRLALADGRHVFITQGDANPAPDADPVREEQVRGTFWYAIPYLGWVTVWLTGPHQAWLVPLAAAALFAYSFALVIAHLRQKRAKRGNETSDHSAS